METSEYAMKLLAYMGYNNSKYGFKQKTSLQEWVKDIFIILM